MSGIRTSLPLLWICCVCFCFTHDARSQENTYPMSAGEENGQTIHLPVSTTNPSIIIDTLLPEQHPDEAIKQYLLLAGQLKLTISQEAAHLYQNLAKAYSYKEDYNQAVAFLQQSMQINLRLHKWSKLHGQYITLTGLLVGMGAYDRVKETYQKLYPVSVHNKSYSSRLNYAMARVHFETGQYDSSAFFLKKTFRNYIYPDRNNYNYFINAFTGLWNIAQILDMPEQAKEYKEAARRVAVYFGDTIRLSAINMEGNMQMRLKAYDKAAEYTLEALKAARKLKKKELISSNAHTLAVCLIKTGNPAAALPYSKESYENATYHAQKITGNNIMGYNLIQLKSYQEAEGYLLRAIELSQSYHNSNLDNTYGQLADLYAGSGQYRLAHHYSHLAGLYKDSIQEKASVAQARLSQLEIKYKAAEKDKALAEQQLMLREKEIRIREKNIWIGCITAGSLAAVIFLAGRSRSNRKVQEQQRQIVHLHARMEGEEQERGRIAKELHDGVSVLLSAIKMHYTSMGNEFSGLTHSASYREIMDLLNKTSYELRSISRNLLPEMLIKESLPEAIRAFCTMVGKGHDVHIAFQHYGDQKQIPAGIAHHVYRIVQELVQNTLKHAHSTSTIVQLIIHENNLHLTIEDDGAGFDAERAASGMGMGLQNIRSRVNSLRGRFTIHTQSGKGSTIEVEIPLSNM